MASKIASFVGVVQLRMKIESASSTDDEPTPIYLLDEVVQAIGSTAKNVADAVDTIKQRLQHRSPAVKQKALRLVKHAAQRGSSELRHALARDSNHIRELTHFRCAPDPFKGDIPWKRVQQYAAEALDALHAAPAPSQASAAQPALGRRIQGFGSDGASVTSGMIGFGSEQASHQQQPSYQHSTQQQAPRQAEPRQQQRYGGALSGGSGGSAAKDAFGSLTSGFRDLTDRAVGALTRPEHARLTSIDSNDDDRYGGGFSSTSEGGGYNGISSAVAGPPQQIGRYPGALAAAPLPSSASGEPPKEQRVVDRICTPVGVRVAPSADDLKTFVGGVAALDGLAVAQALQTKLETGTWQEMLRALCAIEALVSTNSSPAAGDVAVHFQGAIASVKRAEQSAQDTVRQRAGRVLRLLGADTLPSMQGGGFSSAADLLGDSASAPAAAANGNGGGGGNAMDLLAGLEVTAEQSAPSDTPVALSAASQFDMLGNLAAPVPAAASTAPSSTLPAPAAAAAPAMDLFGDWMGSSTAPPGPVVPLAPFASPPAAIPGAGLSPGAGLIDVLSDLSLGATHAHQGPPMIASPPKHPVASTAPTWSPMQQVMGLNHLSPGKPPLPPSNMSPLLAAGQQSFDLGGVVDPFALPPPPLPAPGVLAQQVRPPPPLHSRSASLGYASHEDDVLSAFNAAASGITSSKREDLAFDFVSTAMAELKGKK